MSTKEVINGQASPTSPIANARPAQYLNPNLFGPMLAGGHQLKYIFCIMDVFTKYAMVMAVKNKEAKTFAKVIFYQMVL
jgi:hypothetical protein